MFQLTATCCSENNEPVWRLYQGIPWNDTKPFTANKGCLCRFRNKFGMKNVNITGEATFANEEVAVTFLVKLKKLVRICYYLWFWASTGDLGTYPPWIRRDYTVLYWCSPLCSNWYCFQWEIYCHSHLCFFVHNVSLFLDYF